MISYELQPLTSPDPASIPDWMDRRSPAPPDEDGQASARVLPSRSSWRLNGARWWARLKRADWNLICASMLAVFWFIMYCTSPAGKYMRHNAACPVPMPILSFSPAQVDSVVHAAVQAEHAAWNSGAHHGHSKHEKMHAQAGPAPVPSVLAPVVCPVCTSPVCPAVQLPSDAAVAAAIPSATVRLAADSDTVIPSAWTSGAAQPLLLDSSRVGMQLSSHVGSRVRKRVHVRSGVVPHVLQFAEATFEPGDEAARHMHATATEIFYVRSGVLSIYFDDEPDAPPTAGVAASAAASVSDAVSSGPGVDVSSGAAPSPSNSTAHHSRVVHHLRAHDSVTIPPGRWHRMANTHERTLELVYVTLLTP